MEDLSKEYIRGLVEGEGCFTFCSLIDQNSKEKKLIPAFSIGMHERDENLIIRLRDTLKLKNNVRVYKNIGSDKIKRGKKAFLIVRDFYQIKNIIVPLFYKKLQGYKAQQFNDWIEKIENDNLVPDSYKLIPKLYKNGYYDKYFTE